MLDEKEATIAGYSDRARKLAAIKAAQEKTLKQTEDMKKLLEKKVKEKAILKTEVLSKDAIIALLEAEKAHIVTTDEASVAVNEENYEVIVETEVKRCKKCKFIAPDMQVLGLHIENDREGH